MWNNEFGYAQKPPQSFQHVQGYSQAVPPQLTIGTGYGSVPQIGVYHQSNQPNPNVRCSIPTVDFRNTGNPFPHQYSNAFAPNFERHSCPQGANEAEMKFNGNPSQLSGSAMYVTTQRKEFGDESIMDHSQIPSQGSSSFASVSGNWSNSTPNPPGNPQIIHGHLPPLPNHAKLSRNDSTHPGQSSGKPVTNQLSSGYAAMTHSHFRQTSNNIPLTENITSPLPGQMPVAPFFLGPMPNTAPLYGNAPSLSTRAENVQNSSFVSSSKHISMNESLDSAVCPKTKPLLNNDMPKSEKRITSNQEIRTSRAAKNNSRQDNNIIGIKRSPNSSGQSNKTYYSKHSAHITHKSREKEHFSPRKRKSHCSRSSQARKKIKCVNDWHSEKKDECFASQSHERRSDSSSQSDCSEHKAKVSKSDVKSYHQDKTAALDYGRHSSHSSNRATSSLGNKERQKKNQLHKHHCSKSNTFPASKHKRSDLPLRYISPPPPEIKRVIKFLVPDDYYKLSKHPRTLKTVTNATKKLEDLYKTFESKVLTESFEKDQDVVSDVGEYSNLIPKGIKDTDEENNFELESIDDSDFETDEQRPKDEYSTDISATNCDSNDSADDQGDVNASDSSSDEEDYANHETSAKEYRQRKLADPRRLHPDLWFNEKGEGNDGPVCKCCSKAKLCGIRHAIYPEEKEIPLCNATCNNALKLYHYWVTVTPHCNFMIERPTIIKHKDKDFVFEGFSIVSHQSLDKIPNTSFIRFNIEYSIHLVKEPIPKNFCIKGLELFSQFLFSNVLELLDWTLKGQDKKGCPQFHFIPRFIHRQQERQDGKEVHEMLSMDKVLSHIIKNSLEKVIKSRHLSMPSHKQRMFGKLHSDTIVRHPYKKPAAFRIDNILFSRNNDKKGYPVILHYGIRPVQMSYSGNEKYQKLWKSYKRLRNTLANKPVASRKDRDRLIQIKIELERIRLKSSMRRDVQVRINSEGLLKTGINSDICQHALVLPVVVHHLRYHMCLKSLGDQLGYTFKDYALLQLALTHPSYHLNFGMNPDQARNSLTNCGVKQPRYGDRRIHRMNTKKKGITNLIRIMANLGKIEENQSMIRHNERLEFLGDAVLEFICSSHLFFMLPDKDEGHLAVFRAALVQNSHLAVLAKSCNLSDYMQFSHGPDLCKEEDMNHAMANCFEAILGAVFLESGLKAAVDLFTKLAFKEMDLRQVWMNTPSHPLQIQKPDGDRQLIPSSPVLQKLQKLEESTGIVFTHIRLLARAFTHPQVGFNNLTLGDNQRMEFLGDSVLQLIISIYLYKHFPEHHEGHLTLLRSSLVNNHTQADISQQLGLDKYINFGLKEVKNIRVKLLADVLEAFVAAIYIDKGLKHVETFCKVCFFPRIEDSIVNQEWIDPKSQLQQCCLAVREEGKSPDLPVYKVLQNAGPSHHKTFQVGVYYKGKRCGTGDGQSLHQAEMAAAKDALTSSYFPEFSRQKHLLDERHHEKRTRQHQPPKPREMHEVDGK